MADKPTNPVEKKNENESTSSKLSDIRPGQLNAYNTLDNHIILNQGTYDKFTDVVTEVVYRNTEPDQMTGMMGPFQGIVLRVIQPDSKDIKMDLSSVVNQIAFGRQVRLLQLKVRIPELHIALPEPTEDELIAEKNAVGRAGTKNSSIDFYPTFTAQDEETSKKIPSVGEIVWVTFENIPQQKRGIYLGPVVNSKGLVLSGEELDTPETEAEKKAQENAGTVPSFTYKVPLEQYPPGLAKRGNLVYVQGSGSPMVLGIQSALGVPVTGVIDGATADKIKSLNPDGTVRAAELAKLFGDKFPIWIRTSEFTQNNESGGHRLSPGVPINYWSGRTPLSERNVVEFDGAGNNYGILGFQITDFGNPAPSVQYPYSGYLVDIKDSSTGGSILQNLMGSTQSRPAIQVPDWRKVDLKPLDAKILGGSSLAQLMLRYGGTTGKEVWERNRLEIYAQRKIHGQIAWNLKRLKNTSYSESEKNSIKAILRKTLNEQINPIPEIVNWMNSLPGIQAQTMYYLERVFRQGIGFALWFGDYSVPVITTAADIAAGGDPYGSGGLQSATKGITDPKQRRAAWVNYVDNVNLYGSGKLGRHLTPATGSGIIFGTAVQMSDYGLTDEYTNKVQGELQFWKNYIAKRNQSKTEARKMLKQYLSNLFKWDLSHISDTENE